MPNQIIITCREDADPDANRLMLNTNQLMEVAPGLHVPEYIKLNPGKNVLDVTKLPQLKYGFHNCSCDEDNCQFSGRIEDYDDRLFFWMASENCQDIIEIDLRDFDGAEMTEMDDMFYCMGNLERIYLGKLNTSNVKSMCRAFNGVAWSIDGDTSDADADKSYKEADSETGFYIKQGIRNFILPDLNVASVTDFSNIFGFTPKALTDFLTIHPFRFSFENWVLNQEASVDMMFEGVDYLVDMLLSSCDDYTFETLGAAWLNYQREKIID